MSRKRSLFKRVVLRHSRKLADVQPEFAMISQDRSVELNPYESPIHCGGANRLPPSRYPLLMLLAGVFGVASLGLASLIAVESINMVQRQGYDVEFTKGMIVAAGFAVLGSCWALSCRLYWIRRPRLATMINLVAFGSAGLFWTLLELGVVP